MIKAESAQVVYSVRCEGRWPADFVLVDGKLHLVNNVYHEPSNRYDIYMAMQRFKEALRRLL